MAIRLPSQQHFLRCPSCFGSYYRFPHLTGNQLPPHCPSSPSGSECSPVAFAGSSLNGEESPHLIPSPAAIPFLTSCQSSCPGSSLQHKPLTKQLPLTKQKVTQDLLLRVVYTLLTAPWTFPMDVLVPSPIQQI